MCCFDEAYKPHVRPAPPRLPQSIIDTRPRDRSIPYTPLKQNWCISSISHVHYLPSQDQTAEVS